MHSTTGHFFLAPIASALINKFGCNIVGVAGALITTGSFVLSTLSQSMSSLLVSLGVVGGERSLIFLPTTNSLHAD